ncbi:MAG: hypothetical protein K8H88_14575, partial [Sandaracinaceae bacterium]|nr:hypothetical protein [Sandaracinaceae bacterium]
MRPALHPHARVLAWVALVAACASPAVVPVDAFLPDTSVGTDAYVAPVPDAGPTDSGSQDSGVDARLDSGGSVCTCEAASECELATCDSGTCVRTPVTDGTLCA